MANKNVAPKVEFRERRLYVNGEAATRHLVNGNIVLKTVSLPEGVVMKSIPCHVCDRTGLRQLGATEFGSLGRCSYCQGKGKFTADDVVRNLGWKNARMAEATKRQEAIVPELAVAVGAGASK